MANRKAWFILYGLWLMVGCGGDREGSCADDERYDYSARSSRPRSFVGGNARAWFLADHPESGPAWFWFDGVAVGLLNQGIDGTEEALAVGTFEDRTVFLTLQGLFQVSDDDQLTRLTTFAAPLEFPCCLVPEEHFLVEFQGRLFFRGVDDSAGEELWAFEPSTGTIEIFDRIPGHDNARESAPAHARLFAGDLWFTAYDPEDQLNRALFRFDGQSFTRVLPTAKSTVLFQDALMVATRDELVRIDLDGRVTSVVAANLDAPLAASSEHLFLIDGFSSLVAFDGASMSPAVELWCEQPADHTLVTEGRLIFTCDAEGGRVLGSFAPNDTAPERLLTLAAGSFDSGLLAWREILMFAGAAELGRTTEKPIDYAADGLEPWVLSTSDGKGRMIEDLAPGTDMTCNAY